MKNLKLILCLISLFTLNSGLNAKTFSSSEIHFFQVKNPAQKYAYAGKLHWNQRANQWDKAIVVYNGAPKPDKNHPVWRYVQSLPAPAPNIKHQYNLHYKAFHQTGNCNGSTPLTHGKVWHIGFDQHPVGAYSKAELRQDWNCPKWSMGTNLLHVVDGKQAYRGKALKLQYPPHRFGCKDPKICANWKPDIGGAFIQVTYSYKLKLDKNFDFVIGGKLPGVGGGIANTGGNKPNGSDGWSVRVMWNRHGKLVQYVYHPDQPRRFGEALEWAMDKPLQRGKWHTLKTMVRINSPGQRNGIIKSWLDGKLVLNRNNIRFRNTNKLLIEKFLFASFYGGSNASWAPKTQQTAYFDEFDIRAK